MGVIIIVCIMCICVQYGCDHNRMYYVCVVYLYVSFSLSVGDINEVGCRCGYMNPHEKDRGVSC